MNSCQIIESPMEFILANRDFDDDDDYDDDNDGSWWYGPVSAGLYKLFFNMRAQTHCTSESRSHQVVHYSRYLFDSASLVFWGILPRSKEIEERLAASCISSSMFMTLVSYSY